MSRDRLFHSWNLIAQTYREGHDDRVQCASYSNITQYIGIDLIDENWDRIYRVTQCVDSTILYNNYAGTIDIDGQK